jgi:glyoxylase-like metal-dependent hydrolase (beta-lactamase superfamily II)
MAGGEPVEPDWEIYAVRLGSVDRPARDNFLAPGTREGAMRLDFTMWVLRRDEDVVVVDTGFDPAAGARRGRTLARTPAEAVRDLGVDPEGVRHVVLTHLHYDHAGNIGDFPSAQLVVQARELAFVTGAGMRHASLSHFFEVDDVVAVLRRLYAGGVCVVDGTKTLLPGVELHLVGGHTKGLQIVRVHTQRGWVVLASDALHYAANLRERNPFPAVVEVDVMLDGYDLIERLADGPAHIVPGHDPAVFTSYPGLADHIAVLHRDPSGEQP